MNFRYGFNGMKLVGIAEENLVSKYFKSTLNLTRLKDYESKTADIKSHIDQVYSNNKKVQVKGERHVYQGGPPITDAIAVELQNVMGKNGDIKGHYDWYAHRVEDILYVWDVIDIRKAVNALVKFEIVSNWKDARLKVYQRTNFGRLDYTTLIPLKSLKDLGIEPLHQITISEEDYKKITEYYYKCVREAKEKQNV